jgi:hypothetical protein
MATQSKRTRSKIDRRNRQLRDSLWKNAETRVWDYEKSDGWLNIPRSMPVVMRIMDSLSKGQPVSAAYFDLWCRTYNNGFVNASKPREMAFFSGFDGERAQRTWLTRIKKLEELGFVSIKEGPSGPVSYVLIENPYIVLKKLHRDGLISDQFWNALLARMIEIGADDMEELDDDDDTPTNPPPKASGAPSIKRKKLNARSTDA